MVAAVRVHKHGGPEVLTYEDIEVPAPGQGQIKIKQHACGINFIDCYFRMGMYPSPVGMPFIAGNEGAGEVIAVGPGVTDLKVGDRVAFVGPLGGYAAERLVPADRAVKLPDNITYEQAAGMMLKGMTVQYLVNRTFKVGKGTIVLIHAAAGGVGLIPCQWANHLGATVIGTVGSKDKAELAKKNGCHHTILYRDEDFVAKVKEITSGKLCDVVYDGIGKTTFPASLDCLRPLGYFVSFGSASGPDRRLQHQHPAGQGLAVRHAADAQPLRGQARGSPRDRQGSVREGRLRCGEDSGQPEISAQGRRQGAQGSGRPRHHGLVDPGACRRGERVACEREPGPISVLVGALLSGDDNPFCQPHRVAMTGDMKPWGRLATLGLALAALLAGQIAALAALGAGTGRRRGICRIFPATASPSP